MTSDQFTVIVDYVVINKENGRSFSFSRLPDLDKDLPKDFATSGDLVVISQRVLIRKINEMYKYIQSNTGYKQLKDEESLHD